MAESTLEVSEPASSETSLTVSPEEADALQRKFGAVLVVASLLKKVFFVFLLLCVLVIHTKK